MAKKKKTKFFVWIIFPLLGVCILVFWYFLFDLFFGAYKLYQGKVVDDATDSLIANSIIKVRTVTPCVTDESHSGVVAVPTRNGYFQQWIRTCTASSSVSAKGYESRLLFNPNEVKLEPFQENIIRLHKIR